MLDKDEKWEENKVEAKELAQEFIYDEKRKSECVKYFISHFKISSATAYRWYDKLYNELVIPSVEKENKIAQYKETVETNIENQMKKLKDFSPTELVEFFTKVTKLKKELKKL